MASLGHHDDILLQDNLSHHHDSGFDMTNGGGGSSVATSIVSDSTLTKASTTDFSNPMYDVVGGSNQGSINAVDQAGTEKISSTTGCLSKASTMTKSQSGSSGGSSNSSASLMTGSIMSSIKSSSKDTQFRSVALSPSSVETDKDTQMLVEEDGSD
jgi:hypothetical protein